jgi:hypothetical protein
MEVHIKDDQIHAAFVSRWQASAAGDLQVEHRTLTIWTVNNRKLTKGHAVYEAQHFDEIFVAPLWWSQPV